MFLNAQDAAFITTWKTNNPGDSDSTIISIPVHDIFSYNYELDWNNDGNYDTTGVTGSIAHRFESSGTYTIRIRGEFPAIYFNDSGDKEKILSIDQWGEIEWQAFSSAFHGASNLTVSATDATDLSSVASFYQIFRDASKFNGSISHWDVSKVSDMKSMFFDAESFDQDISEWYVSKVTDMGFIFCRYFQGYQEQNPVIFRLRLFVERNAVTFWRNLFINPVEKTTEIIKFTEINLFLHKMDYNEFTRNTEVANLRKVKCYGANMG